MRFMRSIVPVISGFSLRQRVKEHLRSRSDRRLSSRPRSGRHTPEEGSAIVEFLGLGITLLIPVLYGILTIFSLQSSAMAAHAASAQVVLYVQEQPQDSSVGPDLAQRLAVHAAADYGVEPSDVSVSLSCASGECVSGTKAYATVTVQARLPLLPSFMGSGVIPVSSHATSWGSGHADS